jgi:IS30 family transposase
MGKGFKRMTLKDREDLAILKAEGRSLRGIAGILGFSHSSLSRELQRLQRTFGRGVHYSPCSSDYVAKLTRRKSGRKKSLEDPVLKAYVEERIKRGWSPEIISGRLGLELPARKVSYETIYQHVYDSGFELLGCLPRRHQFRKSKAQYRKARASAIPNRLSLLYRPELINQRRQFGHWESDLVVSGKSKVSLNVLVERLSRYVLVKKIADGTSMRSSRAIITCLSGYREQVRRSITYDNGTENVRHEKVNAALKARSYFCEPYHSWEKGTVENVNGLIRRYIPKKMDLALVTPAQIKAIQRQLNDRPKKCLGYKTPSEVFNSYL